MDGKDLSQEVSPVLVVRDSSQWRKVGGYKGAFYHLIISDYTEKWFYETLKNLDGTRVEEKKI